MRGIFQKENAHTARKYGIYRHLPTYEKIIRNLVSFYHKKKQEIQLIFLSHGYLILMEMQKDRLVHDQWKENKFQNHKYLAYFYMQDILYGQYFLIVILNSMTIS